MSSMIKKLAATFAAAMTFAGPAAAGEPAKDTKAAVSPASVSNFNDHAKAVVFQRNLERDVREEPILVKQDASRYLIHESTILGGLTGEGVGRLKSYSQEDLVKQHGPIENIRTYDQYKADSKVLSSTPGLGPKLSDAASDMPVRLRDLESDMKKAGETYAPPAPKVKHEM